MLCRRAFLRIQIHNQNMVGHIWFEGRLNSVRHLCIAVHFALAFHRGPGEIPTGAPGTARAHGIAYQAAIIAFLQMKFVPGAMAEICQVLVVQGIDLQGHPQVIGSDGFRHYLISFCSGAAAHDHGRTGAWRGPTQIGAYFYILDLSAAAFAIIIGVLAFTVRANRTAVVGLVA